MQSLYLRLQFWIHKLIKLMFAPKQKLTDSIKREISLPGVSMLHIKAILLFLRHQQEIVQDLISHKVNDIIDFEWQSKIKLIWTGTNDAEAVCGGWNQRFGYEYFGTQQRLMITPLTQRYFVFIASALRERSSVML